MHGFNPSILINIDLVTFEGKTKNLLPILDTMQEVLKINAKATRKELNQEQHYTKMNKVGYLI
jgi:hypothetical protein